MDDREPVAGQRPVGEDVQQRVRVRGYRSRSKSRGGFCSNHSRSCSGVSWRKSGVSSSTSSSPSCGGAGGSSALLGLVERRRRVLDRRLVERDVGLGLALGDRLWLRVGGRGVLDRGVVDRGGLGGGGGRRAGELGTLRRAQCLLLLARDLLGIRTPAALELEVLPDGVVEQSHLAVKAYSARTVRFFPERLAR